MNKIAFFGTSHTYGQCRDLPDEVVKKPWTNILAEKCGIESVNFGLPGSTNFEIQIVINEALQNGDLDNVDTIIVEPRLSFDDLQVLNKYNDGEFCNTANNKDDLITVTRQYIDTIHSPWHRSISMTLGLGDFYNLDHFKKKYFNMVALDTKHTLEQKDLQNFVNQYALIVEHNKFLVYKNIEFMKTLQLLMESLGKKFYWINWECGYPIDKNIYPKQKDVIKNCLNTDISVKDYMTEKYGKQYLCSCSHWNEEAQSLISEFVLKRLKLR